MLSRPVPYQDLGDDYFLRRLAAQLQRYGNRLVHQLKRLGFKVTFESLPLAA